MRITLNISNFLYNTSDLIYNSYANGYILSCFNIKLNTGSAFTISSINGMTFDAVNNKLTVPGKSEITVANCEDLDVANYPNFNDAFWGVLSNYFILDANSSNSFLNTIEFDNNNLTNPLLYIVACFPVDSVGNIKNTNFVNNGISIQMDIPDNTTSIILQNIALQAMPTAGGCGEVITNIEDLTININS